MSHLTEDHQNAAIALLTAYADGGPEDLKSAAWETAADAGAAGTFAATIDLADNLLWLAKELINERDGTRLSESDVLSKVARGYRAR